MAAGFKIVRDDRNKGTTKLTATSIVVTIGDLIENVIGTDSWALVTTSSVNSSKKAIATETIASSATGSVDAIILDGTELVEAGSTNNSASADNGDGMIIGTATTGAMVINNTGTTVAKETAAQIFIQYRPVGAAADKRLLGFVLVGNSVIPYAAS